MIRLLLADDHRIIREGLRLILETTEDFEIAGEAANGEEAVRLCAELEPDVVLMDLRMPGMGGIAAIEKITAFRPAIAVVILTTFNEDDLLLKGLRSGARGYLLKDTDRESLFAAIRAAARGETLLKPEMLGRLLADRRREPPAPGGDPPGSGLTEREREVLRAVAEGRRSKEIGAALGISERTVKAHLANIYSKLGVDSRAGAIAVAARRGLI